MGGGAWQAAVLGVAKSRTRLSDFTFTFHFHALEKDMATHSSVLAWRIPGMEKPGGLPSTGSHRVGHDWSDLATAAAAEGGNRLLSFFFNMFFPGFWSNGEMIWLEAKSNGLYQNNLHSSLEMKEQNRAAEVWELRGAQGTVQLWFDSPNQFAFPDLKHMYLELQLTDLLLKEDLVIWSVSQSFYNLRFCPWLTFS